MGLTHLSTPAYALFIAALACWMHATGATSRSHLSPRELLKVFKSSNSEAVPDATVDNRYPFLVQVQGANGEFCSGALINPLTVLTAGHCVPPARKKGEWEQAPFLITARAGTQGAAEYAASWFVRHPGFDPAPDDSGYGYVNNDVALIRLDDCALYPEYATLPCKGGSACGLSGDVYAYGWGRVSDAPGVPEDVRRAGPYAASCDCTSPGQVPYGKPETFFCLHELEEKASGPEEICQGDSGGPVLLEASDLKVVIGVNSFGDGATCGSRRQKNAGYSADLTHPDINKWVCQFASKEEMQAVARVCPAAAQMPPASREVGPSPGSASTAPKEVPRDSDVAQAPTPTPVVQQVVITALDASGRPIKLACGPGLTCTPVKSGAQTASAKMVAVAGVMAGAVLAML